MNFSYPFILRPVATTLLAVGLFLVGAVAYNFLPVASLPSVDFPTIRISASRPGADPATMASTVAAPLERRLGEIAGVTEISSYSSLGSTSITVQFDLDRNIDKAARDVQAAINASLADLPSDLGSAPSFRKANPAASPVLILALTSTTILPSAIYDAADSVIAQRIAQIEGVGDVSVSGAEQPAIRVRVNPAKLAAMGVSLEDVRTAIARANSVGPVGVIDGPGLGFTIATNDQLRTPREYDDLVVKVGADGKVVRLADLAGIDQGVRTSRSAAFFNRDPAVLLIITKQANANVIETVDRVRELLPELQRWIPPGIKISILTDRTSTIRASVRDMQFTLLASVFLVMLVVFAFLRRGILTLAAGVTVPLTLAGTCGAMWLSGFSIDNLSLMALAVSVGFVVDDAIVMIENFHRKLEQGLPPAQAALVGAREIGFTVISISLSLIAAFIPLLFMGGIVGRLFQEFSLTLTFAIVISTVVSLSVTPMICAHYVRKPAPRRSTRLHRAADRLSRGIMLAYAKSLRVVLRHQIATLIVLLGTIVLTVHYYAITPKGFFPQDDTGLVFGGTRASPEISYQAMVELQQRAAEIIMADPAVASVGSSVGGSGWGAVNFGRFFISLKPMAERGGLTTARVVARLRTKLAVVEGVRVFLTPSQDLRVGGRQTQSQYQFTLYGTDLDQLQQAAPRVLEKVRRLPGLVDVTIDREQGGLQVAIKIDRTTASRLGVRIQDINDALNNAFAERQISTIYTQRNQYRIILEVEPQFRRDPTDLSRIYVRGANNVQVPLTSLVTIEKGLSPLVVNHRSQFPAVTVSYNLSPGMTLDEAARSVSTAVAELHLPESIRTEFAGDAAAARGSTQSQPLLILAALVVVYIVLGILYESLAHPLTIISTLPAAGLGALLALRVFNAELTVIALIGIILLIGIVKK
ncbi:MAG: efflux RND transporter permease subunit, partial [Alphaproteobacteria bacterium]